MPIGKHLKEGEWWISSHGYKCRGSGAGRIYEHVKVAEKALGKKLPPGAQVHHVNEDKADNRGENLVICPDVSYHRLLHQRTRALDACGHADWLLCKICKQFDKPENLSVRSYRFSGRTHVQQHHPACNAKRSRDYRSTKKAAR